MNTDEFASEVVSDGEMALASDVRRWLCLAVAMIFFNGPDAAFASALEGQSPDKGIARNHLALVTAGRSNRPHIGRQSRNTEATLKQDEQWRTIDGYTG